MVYILNFTVINLKMKKLLGLKKCEAFRVGYVPNVLRFLITPKESIMEAL